MSWIALRTLHAWHQDANVAVDHKVVEHPFLTWLMSSARWGLLRQLWLNKPVASSRSSMNPVL